FDESLKTLLDQVVAVKEDIRKVGTRVATLEQDHERRNPAVIQPVPLVRPRTKYELKETSTLIDCVKELQTFEGEPGKYVSWINRAQAIVNDYEIIIGKPLYRTIILYIRQKIRGDADLALSSYNVEDDDSSEIKRVLSLHYADKRDVRTLEYQLSQLTQAGKTLDQFYNDVNNHFSLILNKLKQSEHAPNVASALIEMYRDKALDVF
ncbi:hypothetical protein KR067_009406, partial [Drosophila pandora]